MIIEKNNPIKWLPLNYPEGYRYVVRLGDKAAVLDLRDYTLPSVETVPAVSWMDGAVYGTHDIIDHRIDWRKVEYKVNDLLKTSREPNLSAANAPTDPSNTNSTTTLKGGNNE